MWRYVTIDDSIPSLKNRYSKEPAFFKTNEEAWPLLIHKAVAKVYSSYQSLELADLKSVIRTLTGAYCRIFEIKEGSIWNLLEEFRDCLCLKSVFSISKESKDYLSSLGIDPNFAFYITRIFRDNNTGEKLISLKFPLKLNSKNLHHFIQKEEGLSFENPEYVINLITFTKLFQKLLICKISMDDIYIAGKIKHNKNSFSIRSFSLNSSFKGNIELHQKDKMHFRNTGYSYESSRISLCRRCEDGRFQYISGAYSQEKSCGINVELKPGYYCLIACIDWYTKCYESCISFSGNQKINFECVAYKDYKDLIENIFQEKIKATTKPKIISKEIFQYRNFFLEDGLVVEHFENMSENMALLVSKDYSKCDSSVYNLTGTYSKNLKFQFKLLPSKCETIVVRLRRGFEAKNIQFDYGDENLKVCEISERRSSFNLESLGAIQSKSKEKLNKEEETKLIEKVSNIPKREKNSFQKTDVFELISNKELKALYEETINLLE